MVYVRTPASTCGQYPAIGEPWVFVPAYEDWAGYLIHGCDGSMPLSLLSASERALLSRGYPPVGRPALVFAVVGLVVAALVLVSLAIRMRRR